MVTSLECFRRSTYRATKLRALSRTESTADRLNKRYDRHGMTLRRLSHPEVAGSSPASSTQAAPITAPLRAVPRGQERSSPLPAGDGADLRQLPLVEVREHGEHAAVRFGVQVEMELQEDLLDMSFDRPLGNEEARGDRAVREPLGE